MDTMLHEMGHAVYSKNIDPALPFLLRTEAHTFTTEAIAMFFGRLARNASWLQDMGVITAEEKAQIEPISRKSECLAALVFTRWCQVMFRFERELYKNPAQDLNKLWWDLVEAYQYVPRPEGRENAADWAAKIHISVLLESPGGGALSQRKNLPTRGALSLGRTHSPCDG